ncbi:MAG TPA: RuBisCO large subunit C-terminal-like domain-containing protein [Nitrospira sp.]|nr:RuBisCO large subunit C-terminal-like domain-containing protein [Nitrospira sp.]
MASYEINGPESNARAIAERICLDQTIEGDASLLAPPLQLQIVGRLEHLRPTSAGRCEATIRYASDLLSGDCTDLLNVLFGTSSFRGDVTLSSFTLTQGLLSLWRGPRFGIDGLRCAVDVVHRPLLCAVLKPLGRSAQELAELAAQYVEGGVDIIKDDQSLVDQPWCPFEERVVRCAEAIGKASSQRGRPCLYLAHISGSLEVMRRRATQAKALGATGLMMAPGLTGFDALRALSSDETVVLPIACHPTMLGASVDRGRGGLLPRVAYGLLPRLAGADLSIYPTFGSDYPMSQDDCCSVADSCRQSWDHIKPMMPAVGGRVGPERISILGSPLGRDVVLVLGSRIQKHPGGVIAAIEECLRMVTTERSSDCPSTS